MKFTSDDLRQIRAVLNTCKIGGMESVVFSEGKARGLAEKKNAAILSECALSAPVNLGISRISDLMKRLDLFGEMTHMEGELNDQGKVRKLTIKGNSGKIEFRCTDERLITYPKSNDGDSDVAFITITKPEVHLISRAMKTVGAEAVVLQIKREGGVHVEGADANNDVFETELSTGVDFVDEPFSYVHPFDTTSGGVLLPVLEYLAKSDDEIRLSVRAANGNLCAKVNGHTLFIVPRVDLGN